MSEIGRRRPGMRGSKVVVEEDRKQRRIKEERTTGGEFERKNRNEGAEREGETPLGGHRVS